MKRLLVGGFSGSLGRGGGGGESSLAGGLGALLPAHGGVEGLHGERRRRRVDVAVRVHVGLLRARVGAAVLHARLHVHHLQVVELLLRRHAVPVEPVLADDVRVQVRRHARARGHLHVLHRTQVTWKTLTCMSNQLFCRGVKIIYMIAV